MTESAVIQAVYADFRLIKTRSCLQLVFEVPVERATEALAIFGVPNHLTDVHVAIARLQATGAREAPNEPEEAIRKVDTTKSERAKASYRMSDDGERAVTRAAMLCSDPKFQEWLRERQGWAQFLPDHDRAAFTSQRLREELDIATRRDIAVTQRAYAAFLALEAEYKLAIGQMAEIR